MTIPLRQLVPISLRKFFVCCFWFPPRFTLGFYFAYLYMLISHVRKEVSHSDWLFVCKLKTNPRTLLGYNYSYSVLFWITEA